MQYDDNSPFYRLLATKYKKEEEPLGIAIVEAHPEVVKLEWHGPDKQGQPFVSRAVNNRKVCSPSVKF